MATPQQMTTPQPMGRGVSTSLTPQTATGATQPDAGTISNTSHIQEPRVGGIYDMGGKDSEP